MNVETFRYDNRIVRAFAIATVVWGLVGFGAGLLIADGIVIYDSQGTRTWTAYDGQLNGQASFFD